MKVIMQTRSEALQDLMLSLHLPHTDFYAAGAQTAVIAQLLRREVFNQAPCDFREAREAVTQSLSPLWEGDALTERVETVLNDLIAFGDIFEGDHERAQVLRPAPPAFVRRADGAIIVLGVAGEELAPLPKSEVDHLESGLRLARSHDPTEAARILMELGVIELPEKAWLFAPKEMSAADVRLMWINKLPAAGAPQDIDDLSILETSRDPWFYKGRWVNPGKGHSGIFLARRPQRFRAPLWSVADLVGGRVVRFVDIFPADVRVRSCDEAWRFQAAIDALAGKPQTARLSPSGDKTVISFGSPLPSWAARRLAAIGRQIAPQKALIAFEVNSNYVDQEALWLSKMLWLETARGEKH